MDQKAAETAFREAIHHGRHMPAETMPTLLEAARRFAKAGDPEKVPMPDLAWVDDGTNVEIDLNVETRLKRLARRAAEQTPYYKALFEKLGIEAESLSKENFDQIPVLTRSDVSAAPYDFVCRDARVAYRTQTSGTGGTKPLALCFSSSEIALAAYLTAIGVTVSGALDPEDLFLLPASSRQVLSATTNTLALHLIDVPIVWTWLKPPELCLQHLSDDYAIPGRGRKISTAMLYPSQLGSVVNSGLQGAYGPDDFGLTSLIVGGEIASEGLKRRTAMLMGDELDISESYGISEAWGGGGTACSEGNMHFEPTGLWEFLKPDTLEPAGIGEIATCVSTVLPPFRDTMLFLRYNTGDLVRRIAECPCGEGGQITTHLLGKRHLSIQHADGWTTPRDVIEALESVDAIELPARFGFWEEDGGVTVEVVAEAAARSAIGDALDERNVPVKRLLIRDSRDELERTYALRVDGN